MSIQSHSGSSNKSLANGIFDVVAIAQKSGSTLRVRFEAERLWTAASVPDMTREELEARMSRAALRRGIPIEL